MWETLKTYPKVEWNETSNIWLKCIVRYNSNTFAVHFAQYFNQKPPQQQCHEIMTFKILSTVNTIGLLNTWGKYSCMVFVKEIL